ncbi:MAG: formyl transferase [Lachnospiraceae bacterium]|nr:formyl transferase [Lachnospiraceae bacterium]
MNKKVLLLSNNDNVQYLYERIVAVGDYNVEIRQDPLNVRVLEEKKPQLVISYNYRHIVKEDVIAYMRNRIINLHTSLLPWNKGSAPNIWSFIEDTPKGVTVHRLEKGLDTGKIIFQKEITFDEKTETLASSYDRLNREIVDLLMEHFEDVFNGTYTLKEQIGPGSYHKMTDLEQLLNGEKIDYNMTIREFKEWLVQR